VRTRKIAILVANGVEGTSVQALQTALVDAGAVPLLVAPRLGKVTAADGTVLEAQASMENTPPVLFDAMVLPDGEDAVALLARIGYTDEFIKNQYRHCKTILVLGASSKLTEKMGINPTLPTGETDPGLLFADASGIDAAAQQFIDAVSQHRHPARDMDPPLI